MVLIFHITTALLFNIGLFPFLMIIVTLIYFPPSSYDRLLSKWRSSSLSEHSEIHKSSTTFKAILIIFFFVQLTLPIRSYFINQGNILWNEEGYRFSWRVMLVEKVGQAQFTVRDEANNRIWEVDNEDFLTPFQEKRMAVRPDHIIQFAHYLGEYFQNEYGIEFPSVYVDAWVSLNGRPSQRFIDPMVDLADVKRSIKPYDFVLSNR